MGLTKCNRSRDERAELLSLYDQSGMSRAAFAREFEINYTPFYSWLKRRREAVCESEVVFQEVHLEPARGVDAWELTWGKGLCLRFGSSPDVEAVANLVKRLRS